MYALDWWLEILYHRIFRHHSHFVSSCGLPNPSLRGCVLLAWNKLIESHHADEEEGRPSHTSPNERQDYDDLLVFLFILILMICSCGITYKVQRALQRRGSEVEDMPHHPVETRWRNSTGRDCGRWTARVIKIKHFGWRMARNTLAVRMNLERLGIELDTRCVMCNGLNEDGGHLFLGCKYVKHVWRANGMELEHSWQRRDQEGRWSSVFLICRKGAKLKSQASEHLFFPMSLLKALPGHFTCTSTDTMNHLWSNGEHLKAALRTPIFMCLIVDTQNWHKQDKGQNSQFNINSYYFCKFGMYDCCAG